MDSLLPEPKRTGSLLSPEKLEGTPTPVVEAQAFVTTVFDPSAQVDKVLAEFHRLERLRYAILAKRLQAKSVEEVPRDEEWWRVGDVRVSPIYTHLTPDRPCERPTAMEVAMGYRIQGKSKDVKDLQKKLMTEFETEGFETLWVEYAF